MQTIGRQLAAQYPESSGDLGLAPSIAEALFIISRLPGIAAHAEEERERHGAMRQIDPKEHRYDGASERRLPERRK